MGNINYSVISLFPEMFESFCNYGVTSRAFDNSIAKVSLYNPRSYTVDKHQTVDDRPYGGGPGMLMMYTPLAKAVEDAKKNLPDKVRGSSKVIYMSPQGEKFNQSIANELSKESALIFVCGRYEGVDERFIEDYVDREISIGDYVVSGGELPSMIIMDSVLRLLPDVLGCTESAVEDSFYSGLLDCCHYTRPAIVKTGKNVPEVLLSGNHANIADWRMQQRLGRTYERRPELLTRQCLSKKDKKLLDNYLRNKDK